MNAGDVVEWENRGAVAHNVTFDQYPTMTSETMQSGDKFEVKFTVPGTYPYRCTFHPGMNGSVTVTFVRVWLPVFWNSMNSKSSAV